MCDRALIAILMLAGLSGPAEAHLQGSGPRLEFVLAAAPQLATVAGDRLTGVDLVQTNSGLVMLTMLVNCALGPGDVFTVPSPTGADPIDFFGDVGIARGWRTRALTARERELVSGCVLSLLSSGSGPGVYSLRGDGIATKRVERELYTLDEGAFFGDLFGAAGPVFAACVGLGQAAHPTATGLSERQCAAPSPIDPGVSLCGLPVVGLCVSVCQRVAGRYERCRFRGRTFQRVATSFASGDGL